MTQYYYHAPDQTERNRQVEAAFNRLTPAERVAVMTAAAHVSECVHNLGIKGAKELIFCLNTWLNERDKNANNLYSG